MTNLNGRYWFVTVKGKTHLTTATAQGPHYETLCGKPSIGRQGKTGTGDTATGKECRACLVKAEYSGEFPVLKGRSPKAEAVVPILPFADPKDPAAALKLDAIRRVWR